MWILLNLEIVEHIFFKCEHAQEFYISFQSWLLIKQITMQPEADLGGS